jgi:phosphate-selective porin OprO/OprP
MTLEPETVGESLPGTVTSPDVNDAYFSVNEIPGLGRFRIGNFFVPFSLEQVTNDTNNIFLERSIPTQGIFAPDREVGIAVYNQAEEYGLAWASGVFFDSIREGLKERINDNQGCRVSGRLTWLPYYDEASKGRRLVHTGAGILHTSDQDDRIRIRARPQIHEGPRLIDTGVLQADSCTAGNVELAIVNGPVTLQSEGFPGTIDLHSGSPQNISGAYAHLSWFVTGESRIYEPFGRHGSQFGRNKPARPLRVQRGCLDPGALELKTRCSHLNLDSLHHGQYNDLSVGFNWYWSDRTRIMFDWIHPVTTTATKFGDTTSDIIGLRFDFNW